MDYIASAVFKGLRAAALEKNLEISKPLFIRILHFNSKRLLETRGTINGATAVRGQSAEPFGAVNL
jgi:hypothetical protein